MDDEERRHYEELGRLYRDRLRLFELREAQSGASTPPEVLIEMKDLREKIVQASAMSQGSGEITRGISSRRATPFLPKKLVLSKKEGQIVFAEWAAWFYESFDLDVQDFVTEVRFYNPLKSDADNWLYGFAFRQSNLAREDPNFKEFRLFVQSEDLSWILQKRGYDNAGQRFVRHIAQGKVDQLNTKSNGSNYISILALGMTAFLFVNGRFVETINVGEILDSGYISLGFGLLGDDRVIGKALRYEQFNVWAIDL